MPYEILPLQSIGPLEPGRSRQEVHALVGPPTSTHDKFEYYDHEGYWFMLEYRDNKVVYIEFRETGQPLLLSGLDVFRTPAEELIPLVVEVTRSAFDPHYPEIPYAYVFPELELSLWMPVPLKEENNDKAGIYFETVGIGVKGYF